MESEPQKSRLRFVVIGVFALVACAFTAACYFLVREFLEDRQDVLLQRDQPLSLNANKQNPINRTETKTYTAEELEAMRKQGKSPEGFRQPPGQTQAIQANEAAVQRSLKTLEDINRINQMNQQLLEQQQRMNRQR